jgi:hypothetical protein
MRIWWGHALLAIVTVAWVGCAGPARHPAPLVPEIGADPILAAEKKPDPSARAVIKDTEASEATEEVLPSEPVQSSSPDAAATPASEEPTDKASSTDAPEKPSKKTVPETPAETSKDASKDPSKKPKRKEHEYEFLFKLVMDVAGRADEEKNTIAVFPAAHVNELFGGLDVSQLGYELGQSVDGELRKEVGEPFKILSPDQFAKEIQKSNRSLADITQVPEIFQLANRIGADYLVVGMIYDGDSKFEIAYDCIDVKSHFKISVNMWPYEATDPVGKNLYRKFKDENGQPILSDAYKLGARAGAGGRDLSVELNWLFARAMRDIVKASGPVLRELPIAVLPVRLPKDFNFLVFQRMHLDYVEIVKKRLIEGGKTEEEALADGPHRIIGKTFSTLGEAAEYARELVLQQKTSKAGKFQSTISRILFDQLENLQDEFGIKVVKHEEIVNEALQYTQEELDKVNRGMLTDEKRSSFQASGAGAMLYTEFLEADKWFEFRFQLRRVDDLDLVLHAKLKAVLEPEFGYRLRKFFEDGNDSNGGK